MQCGDVLSPSLFISWVSQELIKEANYRDQVTEFVLSCFVVSARPNEAEESRLVVTIVCVTIKQKVQFR